MGHSSRFCVILSSFLSCVICLDCGGAESEVWTVPRLQRYVKATRSHKQEHTRPRTHAADIFQKTRDASDVTVAMLAVRQEVGALRAEISVRLEQVSSSNCGLDQRLLDIESSFMNHVNARIDGVVDGINTTHMDIHGLSLDIDKARDDVCSAFSDASSRATTGIDAPSLPPAVADQVMAKIDESHSTLEKKIDGVHHDLKSAVLQKLEHTHTGINEVQKNIDSTRRRLTERINNAHEGLAGIIHNWRDRVGHKVDWLQSALGPRLAAQN